MRIAMVCYPTVGGSGIVATELGKHLAHRGHRIHFISTDVPFRLREFHANIQFHQVETPGYYLFRDSPYILSLANKILEVHRMAGLDIIHAHYAVPHATAAFLAREMIRCDSRNGTPKVITTLHGTDITLMAAEPSFSESVAFAINCSDSVTAVSASLRRQTYELLRIAAEIHTIPNFLDCDNWRPQPDPAVRASLAHPDERILTHMSNFRPVKRVEDVIDIFARVAAAVPSRLLMVGDGPDLPRAVALARDRGVADRVTFLGNQEEVIPLLSATDVFLLPSQKESFGLAALEAMACGVPVVASTAGGLPEVIPDGECGFLRPVGDIEGMAAAVLSLLNDGRRRDRMGGAARRRVHQVFCADRIVPQYEAHYQQVLGA